MPPESAGGVCTFPVPALRVWTFLPCPSALPPGSGPGLPVSPADFPGAAPCLCKGSPAAPGDPVPPPARPSPCFTERAGTVRRLQVTPALRP